MPIYSEPVYLVPADDWSEVINLFQQDGTTPLNLTGWTISKAQVRLKHDPDVVVTLIVDSSQLPLGKIPFTAGKVATAALELGNVSEIEVEGISPAGLTRTLYYNDVCGVTSFTTNVINVSHVGFQGPAGFRWRSDWATTTGYLVSDVVIEDGSLYIATVAHTSSADTQPGVGADWEDVWDLFLLGADEASIAIVAANIASVNAVAGSIGNVNLVAASIANVNSVANNLTAINTTAGISAQIQVVAAIEEDVQTVATYSAAVVNVSMSIDEVIAVAAALGNVNIVATNIADVGTVAASIANVNTAAANIAAINIAALNIQAIIDAPTYAGQAFTYAGQALGYKDETSVLRALTEALKSSVDQTALQLNTLIGTLPDLSGITAAMLGTAVRLLAATDIVAHCWWFSDADEMRAMKRAQRGTSWYAEAASATRGSRKDFPQNKLVVARAASVTIYDMDNGGAMWMVFSAGANKSLYADASYPVSSVAAGHGVLFVGSAGSSAGGLSTIDFIADESFTRINSTTKFYPHKIGSRNTDVTDTILNFFPAGLVNRTVNSVAAYVAPGTPRDFMRAGLPTPTVAVGTAGGVSVIFPDGRVTNSAETTSIGPLAFGADGTLWYSAKTAGLAVFFSPAAEYWMTGFARRYYLYAGSPGPMNTATTALDVSARRVFRGTARGLDIIEHVPASGMLVNQQANRSSVASITRDFNTGWMTGNTLYCGAESTRDQTNLIAATPLSTNFASYADQAAMEADGWYFLGCTASIVSGRLRLTSTGTGNAYARKQVALTAGLLYSIRSAVTSTSGARNSRMMVYDAANNTLRAAGSFVLTGPLSLPYRSAASESAWLWIGIDNANSAGNASDYDNVSVGVAVEDRSAAGNHPVVVGTVGRTPVATNAELCAYTGFSFSVPNALELPYSPALDFGTGDWCSQAWVKGTGGGPIIHRQDAALVGARIGIDASGNVARALYGTSAAISGTTNIYDGAWHLVIALRRSGVVELWVDGRREATVSNTTDHANATAVTRIGVRPGNGAAYGGAIALPRIGASAPTPAQIRQAYADELAMFQPGAKILLSGSGVVNQPAYDRGTGSLYVPQTTGGTDVFVGLCRIATRNIASVGAAMTSDNHKAVVAENENVAFITANEVYVETPTIGMREALTRKDAERPYDRAVVRWPSAAVTTNATPTAIGYLSMDKGEAGTWYVTVTAREWGEPAAPELASYDVRVTVARPQEGNIAVSGSPSYSPISETTGTMDVTVAANTTVQALAITATGVAAKNVEWGIDAYFVPSTMQVAA